MSTFAAAPDVAAEITRWLGYLGAEQRMSPKTLEAYQRDVGQFLDFLAGISAARRRSNTWPSLRPPTCAPSWRRGAATASPAGR